MAQLRFYSDLTSAQFSSPFDVQLRRISVRTVTNSNFFATDFHASGTILDIKKYLEKYYFGSPLVSEQRIIYAGRLLTDNDIISEKFAEFNTLHTIHLVHNPSDLFTTITSSFKTVPIDESSSAVSEVRRLAEIRNRYTKNFSIEDISSTNEVPTSANFTAPAVHHVVPQACQVVMINGQPYIMQGAPTVPNTGFQLTFNQPLNYFGNAMNYFNTQPIAAPQVIPQPAAAQVLPPVAPMGGGGVGLGGGAMGGLGVNVPGDDEFGENAADNLLPQNQLFLLIKLGIAVYVLTQGSSTFRVVLVNLIALLIFLYQTGRVRVIMRVNNQDIVNAGGHAPAAAVERLQQPHVPEEVEPQPQDAAVSAATPTPNNAGNVVPPPPPPPPQRSLFQQTQLILYSFIVSLIPEQQQQEQNA